MKKILVAAMLTSLAACGVPTSDSPDVLVFVAKDDGIEGSYFAATYDTAHVRKRVAELACADGRLATYGETPPKEGRVTFNADCSGALKYDEGTAGFTINDVAKRGRVTAPVNGQLVQIQL